MKTSHQKVSFPRVLIVNADRFEKESPTGYTLRGIFENWPKEQYLQIYLNEMGSELPSERTISAKSAFPFSILMRSVKSSERNEANKASIRQEIAKESYLGKLKRYVRRCVIIIEDIGPMCSQKINWQILDNFSADAIYTIGGSVRAMKLAVKCSKKMNIPIVVHFMDDWPQTLQLRKGVIEKLYGFFLTFWLKRCLERSTGGLGISPFMAEEYQTKYKIPFSWVGCVGDSAFLPSMSQNLIKRNKSFIYAGGLHLGRWKSLVDIESAIADIAPDYCLEIYTSSHNCEMYKGKFQKKTIFHDSVGREELPRIYQSASCLVYVENTDDSYYEAFCRLSISTKLPECLLSGSPLLFYGPKSLGVFKLLADNRLAATASCKSELENAINVVLDEKLDVENSIEFSKRNFSLEANLNRMANLLHSSIDRWGDGR